MKSSRKQRWQQLQSVFEPGFKQMLLVSILIHLLVPVLYYSPLFPEKKIKKPPVYRVNLVNKIVKNPQAGRPEATVVKKKPKVKPKPKPIKKPKVKPKPKPKPVKPKPVKPKSKPKPVPVKPKPKSVPAKPKPKPVVSKVKDNARQSAMDKMRAKMKRQKILDSFYADVETETATIKSPISDAPVGMLDGRGDEIGVGDLATIREFIQQQWVFSQYQVVGEPEAEVRLFYNSKGTMSHYKFIHKSGNSTFDDSLIKAIVKSKQLPQDLPQAVTLNIVFNLKEMLKKR